MEATKEKQNRFAQLVDTLSAGWEIEQPVLLGAIWANTAYHFVLRNKAEDKTELLSLRPSPELLVFLSENNISIKAI